ncbi:hypothetical protein [Actinomadura chokoriensis]|uniref:DUF5666 domain-containing protein n=1 Tax=Actinomadura chokoriensis TaxID=454156 RepID=A0ABV4QUW1_9ACTN
MSRNRGDEPLGKRVAGPSEPPMDDAELLSSSPFDDDLDATLEAGPRRRSLPGPTLYLAAGIILVAGFLGGVQAQKWSSDGSGSSGTGPAGGLAGGRAAGGYGGMPGGGMPGGGFPPGGGSETGGGPMGGGAAGGGAAGGDATTGTIVKIVGNTIYLRTASGQTVKVKTSGTTKVRITENGALKDLGSGATVTVRGSKGEDGTVTATTVNKGSGR